MAGEGALHVGRAGERVARRGEGDEEGVALGIHLAPVVARDGAAQQLAMVRQHAGIVRPESLEQAGGALYIGEEEGDGPSRQRSHAGTSAVDCTTSAYHTCPLATVPGSERSGKRALKVLHFGAFHPMPVRVV